MIDTIIDVSIVGISIAALAISIVSALRLYDKSQHANAKDVFIYPIIFERSQTDNETAKVCVDNQLSDYPIFNIEVFFLGYSCDPGIAAVRWGTAQQILPHNKKEISWLVSSSFQAPTTDIYVKTLMDCMAEEFINYRIACLFSTSIKRRWLKTNDGEFYRYNSVIAKFRKLPKVLKKAHKD